MRNSVDMIFTVTKQSKVRFMLYRETMNAQVLLNFSKQLIKAAGRKVILILHNLRVHRAELVKAGLADHIEQIEFLSLPAYVPELSLDECLNLVRKAGVHFKRSARDPAGLKKNVVSHMRELQKSPDCLETYFKHPQMAYAG